MRISDWSLDVCSSDLELEARGDVVIAAEIVLLRGRDIVDPVVAMLIEAREAHRKAAVVGGARRDLDLRRAIAAIRSAERRVGNESVSTCRSWWSAYHKKKKKKQK